MKRTDIGIDERFDKYVKTVGKGRGSHYIDLRNKIVDDIYHVYPVGFSEHQVIIICPICGQCHYHGLCADNHYWGPRESHCFNREKYCTKKYYIEKVRKKVRHK